jgi:hypothetical protein
MSPRFAPRRDQPVELGAGLASPFLDSELFQEEAALGQEVRLAALAGETAFRLDAEGDAREDVVRRALAEAPGWERVESEIIGTNDMDAVANSLAVPYRWVCRLEIDYDITPFGTAQRLTGSGLGTGTLISPCHVLTSAHNLIDYDPVRKNTLRATRIRVTPAHDGSSSPPVATVEADLSRSPLHRLWDITRRHDARGTADNAGEVETNRYDYAAMPATSKHLGTGKSVMSLMWELTPHCCVRARQPESSTGGSSGPRPTLLRGGSATERQSELGCGLEVHLRHRCRVCARARASGR